MKLIWKLLRQHISIPQLLGFFFANLLGMLIVLLSLQFYRDVKPIFSQEDGFIKPEYLIVSKKITAMGALGTGGTTTFSSNDIDDLTRQPFCKGVGGFVASQYKVACSLGLQGVAHFGTEMFFESVPDPYVDTDMSQWKFDPENPSVPIILPRTYLAIYNFGFAQSQSLPKISEGVIGLIDMTIDMRGAGREERIPGRVIGFSSRLNTILVPQSFIQWSNDRFAPDADTAPTRLIVEVKNPADDAIVTYMNQHGYELEDDKLDAGKTTYFLKVVSFIVMSVGLLISLLSFYILMLSIYLLVQKNTEKLRNLLLIGYSPFRVSMPYQLLTIGMNACVLVLALVILYVVRQQYMEFIWTMFPQIDEAPMWPAYALGACLFFIVSILNVIAIWNRIIRIWKNKD